MGKNVGGFWVSIGDSATDRLEHILDHRSGSFTKAAPISYLSEGSSALALLSICSDQVNYISIVTAGARISDLERKLQIGPVVKLNEPISTNQLIEYIPNKVKRFVNLPYDSMTAITTGTWNHLYEKTILLSKTPDQEVNKLRELLTTRSKQYRDSLPEIISFERDAFATAIDVFGSSTMRKNIISDAAAIGSAPFITRLKHRDVRQIEDQMISHDAINFPGLRSIQSAMVGAVQLANDNATLTVLNANRTTIEKTLGVDLIYYNHDREAFVLVQYKRLTGDEEPIYRPNLDKNLEKELKRMRAFKTSTSSSTANYLNFRLNDNPFFLKLCKSQSPGDWNGRMLQGMYFPLEMWDLLLKSDFVKGPKGGIRVGFNSAPRRMSNSEFTRLLEKGWIGTNVVDTNRLNDLLELLLSQDHSVVAAVQETIKNDTDYYRDQFGRFQSPSDPFAI
jgi:hypothetical protein